MFRYGSVQDSYQGAMAGLDGTARFASFGYATPFESAGLYDSSQSGLNISQDIGGYTTSAGTFIYGAGSTTVKGLISYGWKQAKMVYAIPFNVSDMKNAFKWLLPPKKGFKRGSVINPFAGGGKWFQIHTTKKYHKLDIHTHNPEVHGNRTIRRTRATTAEDIDYADEQLRNGRKDKSGQ